jgi:hypothetical protein
MNACVIFMSHRTMTSVFSAKCSYIEQFRDVLSRQFEQTDIQNSLFLAESVFIFSAPLDEIYKTSSNNNTKRKRESTQQ